MMVEGPNFAGMIGGRDNGGNFCDMAYYRKLGEGSNMSIDSLNSMQTSTHGGSIAMSVDNSSVGSCDSHTRMLNHPGLKGPVVGNCSSVDSTFFR